VTQFSQTTSQVEAQSIGVVLSVGKMEFPKSGGRREDMAKEKPDGSEARPKAACVTTASRLSKHSDTEVTAWNEELSRLDDELCELIHQRSEDRGREYKAPMAWNNDLTKAKITRAVLAMSNKRDGGSIIIGMRELDNKQFDPVGLSNSEAQTFNHDTMADHIRQYADPYVDFAVRTIKCDGKDFIIVQVKEFDEIPVICKKDGTDLRNGAMYARSRTKNESAEVSSQSEMREIMDMAVDKGVRKFLTRSQRIGLSVSMAKQDAAMFDKQLEDFV
jgi:hypothetical protein